MEIRIQSTGAVVLEQEFRAMFPNTSLPVPLTESAINGLGGDIVFEGPQATGGTVYQYSVRSGVEQLAGKWYTKYILGPVFTDTPEATAAEQEAAYKAAKDADQASAVRADRNARLAACDWTQLSDAPVDDLAWAVYRQALRDISSQPGFPWTVDWPVAPG
jgi:hypothetical protein